LDESTYTEIMLTIAQAFEMLAAAVLIAGLFLSFGLGLRTYWRHHDGTQTYLILRRTFGGVLLLGLEILVAGDLIRTVAIAPTIENVVVLGLIVLIRTFLSFSLEIEIEGVPPWRRAFVSGATVVKKAAQASGGA
jgi:uncharacterized membrane protein